MKRTIKTFSLVLASLSALLFASSCKDDLKPQEQEVDFSVSCTPPQAHIEREGQMVTTQLLVTEQEVECPRPTKYSVSFAYDETVGTLLFLGKSVQSGASIPLASLTNLSLTYQAKELMGNKVKVTVTNDAPKAVSKEAAWTVTADDTYSVETSQEGQGELVVLGAKDLKRVPSGTKLTVTATPADGWELVALTANDVDILKSKTFEVAENTTVRATFTTKAPTTYAVTLTKEGEGEVAISGADNLDAVVTGSKLTVTATPADGWELTSLTANGADILSSKTFVVYNPTDVKATFTKKAPTTYAVTLTKEGEGNVTITGANDLNAVQSGTKLTVTATPASGWELTSLTANGADILSSKTFVVYNPTEVKAVFTKKAPTTYAVTLTKEGEGNVTITGADDLNAVQSGTKLTVTATPADGWELASLTANGGDILSSKTFVVYNPTEVKAVFTKKAPTTYAVTLTQEGEGKVAITGANDLNRVPAGTKLTVTAIPAKKWKLTGLTANGADILSSKSFVVYSPTEIKATFVKEIIDVAVVWDLDGLRVPLIGDKVFNFGFTEHSRMVGDLISAKAGTPVFFNFGLSFAEDVRDTVHITLNGQKIPVTRDAKNTTLRDKNYDGSFLMPEKDGKLVIKVSSIKY